MDTGELNDVFDEIRSLHYHTLETEKLARLRKLEPLLDEAIRTRNELGEALLSTQDSLRRSEDKRRAAEAQVEQLRVQLAGCGVAASGGTAPEVMATSEMYSWSPSYQSVLDLRLKYDALRARLAEARRCVGWCPEMERLRSEVGGMLAQRDEAWLRIDTLKARVRTLEEALREILSCCDARPEGETFFERAVIATRAVLSSTPEEKPNVSIGDRAIA